MNVAAIPFNKPWMTGKEAVYLNETQASGCLSGDGPYTHRCHQWLEQRLGTGRALLTHSGTAALEMAALLAEIAPGDEVIMPSFTYPSTANAFVLRGGVPVFVDIRPDTLNIDERLVADAITPRTRAIVPVHYAGVPCDMDAILGVSRRHGLLVIEDAAQGILSTYNGRALGTIGELGCLSFHDTKNLVSGEGGALLINDRRFDGRAEIIREKGTDRSRLRRGEINRYQWCDVGSSFLPSELNAAMLLAQLEDADAITRRRFAVWDRYQEAFAPLEDEGLLRRPVIPAGCTHNAHIYYLLLAEAEQRPGLLQFLKDQQIQATFHYVPLHSSIAGRKYGRAHGSMTYTDSLSSRVIRLPLWAGMTDGQTDRVIEAVSRYVTTAAEASRRAAGRVPVAGTA